MSEKNINWVNDIPLPLPGPCYIEPKMNIDFKDHDDSLETFLPPTIYTDPLDLLNIDYMKIVLDDLCGTIEDSNIKKSKIYEEEYDYEEYMHDSFNSVYEYEHPIDKNIKIKNVYDVYSGSDEKFVVLQSENIELEGKIFNLEDNEHSNLHKYLVNENGEKIYKGIRFYNNEYMMCQIIDDKMYFYDVECIFKYKEVKKNLIKKV